ncbi:MAG: RidA family protein [Vicinamibacterales bacterium]
MTGFFDAITPASLGRPSGYSQGLLAPAGGRVLFVAGQTAPAFQAESDVETFQTQFEAVLGRILAVVEEAGGSAQHIGRMTVYVTSMATYAASRPELGSIWQRRMGAHYPAMAVVEVTRLFDAAAVVEIEATAVLP